MKKRNLVDVLVEQVEAGLLPDAIDEAWDAEDLIQWITTQFWIPEMVGVTYPPAMPLAEYQKVVLREAHKRDKQGRFVYDLVLWSDIKKSAKSSIAAAVTLFRALRTPWGSFKIVANDLDQAASRVFYYLQRAVELNPDIRGHATIKQNKITFDNKATIQAVPIDPSGEAGANDDFVEFTELHGAKSSAQVKMWGEMTIPPNKHGYAQRWIDTYAGYAGEAPVLEPLYTRTVKPQYRLDPTSDIELYARGRILTLWNTRPRLPWQTQAYYESERVIQLTNEFDRIHRNQWVSSTESFVPVEWWNACQVEKLPELDQYREIVLALDAAVSGDCFGIVGMYRTGDRVAPVYIRKWDPPKGGVIRYSNAEDPNDPDYPEGEIRRLVREYNVVAIGYDEYQLHHLCTSLSDQNLAYFIPFSQQGNRLKADKQFRDMIRERRFIHDGNVDLTEHVHNSNAKTEGERLRIVHRTAELKIDLAVCASMASDLALAYLAE